MFDISIVYLTVSDRASCCYQINQINYFSILGRRVTQKKVKQVIRTEWLFCVEVLNLYIYTTFPIMLVNLD